MQRKNLYKVKKIENSTTTAYSVPFRGPAQDRISFQSIHKRVSTFHIQSQLIEEAILHFPCAIEKTEGWGGDKGR